jgi:protein TonB
VTPPAVVEAAPAASEPPPAPAPASAPAEIVPAPVAPPPAPTVKLGDLVSSGRGVVPPALVTMARPSYPPLAKRQRIEGDVSVEVLVDENGNVAQARIVKRVAQNVGLNEAAEAAARTARFKPATKDGVRVRMWFTLTFPFRL